LLRGDARYAAKAARITELTRDLVELVAPEVERLRSKLRAAGTERIAFHPPCTLQHAQRLQGRAESVLVALQAELVSFPDAHLCCGSAGTYSLLQADIAGQLRDRKLAAVVSANASVILSANIGCISHLRGAAAMPVRHWIEWVADRLT
jgi:glycolate oxidase iron-sulfur subunit